MYFCCFLFKQKTAYVMRISDWSSDVCSSDLMDGSSAPFVFLIECADLIEQVAPRRYLRILKKVEVRDGEASAALLPAEGFAIDFEIEFANQMIGRAHV